MAMASTGNGLGVEFTEATNNWNLEKLYIDLASAKGKGLTTVEKKFLRGLLCGYSPSEIADQVYQSRSSSSVRVYLSNGLYKYIQELLIRQTGKIIKIKNWSYVSNLLETAGYKRDFGERSPKLNINQAETINYLSPDRQYSGWEQVIDVGVLYGRSEELAEMEHWILKDNCRLIALLGMGGIGKTALAVKLAQQIQEEFDCAIWRSLHHAPAIEDLLADLLQYFSTAELPVTTAGKMALLMSYLRSQRCLLVLDRVDKILCSGEYTGYCSQEHQEYGELIKRIGEEKHRSCLLLTSREKPKEIAFLEGEKLPVRSLELTGLKTLAAQELLQVKGLVSSIEERRTLVKSYGGNPLALKIVATTIQDVFNGDLTEFLAQGILVFGDFCDLLDQQFNRLSDVEKKVMYWLTMNYKLLPMRGLREQLIPGLSKRQHLEAFESLRRRSLLEKNSTSLTLPPAVRAYIAENLVQQISEEITNKEVALLIGLGLTNSQTKDTSTGLTA